MTLCRGGWSPPGAGASEAGGADGETPARTNFFSRVTDCVAEKFVRWLMVLGMFLVAVILIMTTLRFSVTSAESSSPVSGTASLVSESISLPRESGRITNNNVNKKNYVTMVSRSGMKSEIEDTKSSISERNESLDENKKLPSIVTGEIHSSKNNPNERRQQAIALQSQPLMNVVPLLEKSNKVVIGDVDDDEMASNEKSASFFSSEKRSQDKGDESRVVRNYFKKLKRSNLLIDEKALYANDTVLDPSHSTKGEFKNRKNRFKQARSHFLNGSDSFLVTADRQYDLNGRSQSIRKENRSNLGIKFNPEQRLRLKTSKADSANDVTKFRRNILDQKADADRPITISKSKLQPVSSPSSQASKFTILLSDPKDAGNQELDTLFNNSREILDPFSIEQFDSTDILQDVSIEVVDYVDSGEADFTIINLRNLSDEKSTKIQKNLMQKLPFRREDIHFVSSRKSPNGKHSHDTELPLTNTRDEYTHDNSELENDEFGVRIGSMGGRNLHQNERSSMTGLTYAERDIASLEQGNKKISRLRISRRKLKQPLMDSSSFEINNSHKMYVPTNASSARVSSTNVMDADLENKFNLPSKLLYEKVTNDGKTIANSSKKLEKVEAPRTSEFSRLMKTGTHQQNKEMTSQHLRQEEEHEKYVSQNRQPTHPGIHHTSRLRESAASPAGDGASSSPAELGHNSDGFTSSKFLSMGGPGLSSPVLLVGEDFERYEAPAGVGTGTKTGTTNEKNGTGLQRAQFSAMVSFSAPQHGHRPFDKSWGLSDGGRSRDHERGGYVNINGANDSEVSKEAGTYVVEKQNTNHFPSFQTSNREGPRINSETIQATRDTHGQPQSVLRVDDSKGSYYSLTAFIPKGHLHISLISQHKELERSKPIDLSSKYSPPESIHKGTSGLPSVSNQEDFQSSQKTHSSPQKSRKNFHSNAVNSAPQSLQKANIRTLSVYETKLHGEGGVSSMLPISHSQFYQPLKLYDGQYEKYQAYKSRGQVTYAQHPNQAQITPATPSSYRALRGAQSRPPSEIGVVGESFDAPYQMPLNSSNQEASKIEYPFDNGSKEIFLISPEGTSYSNVNGIDLKIKNIDDGSMVEPKKRNDFYSRNTEFIIQNDHSAILKENLQNNGNTRLQQKSTADHNKQGGNTETAVHSIIPSLAASIDYADSYHKFANRSWPTYDFSFHFHRDLARKSEFRRRFLSGLN